MKYRSDIDGLRAVAVLSVVAFHAFPKWIRGGFIGVDIFFVISGYLISSIILSDLERGQFSIRSFYDRRIRRIFPSLLAIMATSLAVGWYALLASEYAQLGKHISGGAVFLSNFVLWKENGYFDNAAETKPMLHLWSLAIEEQFYIFWPLALGLIWRQRWGFLRATGMAALISFIINIYLSIHAPTAAFYLSPSRFWELLIGGMLAYSTLHKPELLNRHSHAQSIIGSLLIIGGLYIINKDNNFPGWRALLPTLGAFFLISAGSSAYINKTFLSSSPLVWVGLISYPLYLWHWPLLSLARILYGDLNTPTTTMIVGASILLSILTYRLIERPIRHSKSKSTPALLATGMFMMVVAGFAIQHNGGAPKRPVALASNKFQQEIFDYGRHWSGWSDCDFVNAPNPNLGGCKILDSQKDVSIVVIGDSHAGHLATGLRNYFKDLNQNVAVLLHAGCYPFYSFQTDGKEYFPCDNNLINSALDFASKKDTVKIIILAGYANVHIYGKRLHEMPPHGNQNPITNQSIFEAGLRHTLSSLSASNKKIVYLIDNPELLGDPTSCIDRGLPFIKEKCNINIPKDEAANRNSLHKAILDRSRPLFPSIAFISLDDALCNEYECRGIDSDGLLYQSRDHLSPHGSTMVVKYIFDRFDWRGYMK